MNKSLLFSVMANAGFDYFYAGAGQEIKFACPECQDDRERLYMSTSSGLWICHHCKEKGNLFFFLYKYCDIGDAWETEQLVSEIRGGREDLSLPTPRPSLEPVKVELPKAFTEGGEIVDKFLQSRNISSSWGSAFGIGHCLFGRYSYRIIVPVYTNWEIKTFVARTWLPNAINTSKVLMPSNSLASEALFGYDILTREVSDYLFIVEGVFDAMHVMESVGGNCVATLGAHMTDAQRRLVQQSGFSNIILLRDNDQAGREAVIKEARELKAMMLNVSIATLPEGKDPGDATPSELAEAINNAVEVKEDYGTESIIGGIRDY